MVETTYNLNTPVSLALLSDLHGRDPEPVLKALRTHMETLDLIAIVGDFIYGTWPVDCRSPLETQEHVLPFLSGCSALAPTFVSLGNHEQMLDHTDLDRISSTEVTVLDNDWKSITVGGKEVILGGLTSAYVTDYRRAVATLRGSTTTLTASESDFTRYPKKESIEGLKGLKTASERLPDTSWLQTFSSPGYHILLCHHPEYLPLVPDAVDLVLSGHAHGGQWRLYNPFKREWRGVFAPGQGFWPSLTSGVHDGRLVISRGLANTASVPRLFNPTEIVYIR